MGAALAALTIAILPGALRLVPAGEGVERAHPVALGALDTRQPHKAGTPTAVAAAPPPSDPASAPLPSAPPVEVAIAPPASEVLTGELAPVVPSPAPFEQARTSGQPGEVFALIVGINDYPGSRYDLGSAVADANTVNDALSHFGVPSANRVVLRDGQARHDQLVAAVRALVRRAGSNSTIVLAYAGHVRKVDHDTEAIIAADGGVLTDQELASLLAPSRAGHMWLLMATCFGGGFTELLGPGRILTAAADANSLAYESPSIHGSYLVHHMVREGWLQGKAGSSVQEAFAYADARIKERYPDRRPVQLDQAGGRLRFGSATAASSTTASSGTGSPPTTTPPPPSPTTTEPPDRCNLIVLCRRS
jgi:hypothetical protein